MHPELIGALAREREADRLRQRQHFRHRDVIRFSSSAPRAEWARHRLGLFLVGTGSRLLTKESVEVERLERPGFYVG